MHTKLNCFHVLIFKYTLTLLLLITVKTRTVRYNEAPRLGSTKKTQKPEAKLNETHRQGCFNSKRGIYFSEQKQGAHRRQPRQWVWMLHSARQ
jgi:hypothetical protein